ncbi:hypothetical protein FRACA_1380019 [Frankia canadensis]|uniref:Uncharacterized protein n=1 Tax=Frankia canadensis TaxID=1836972 RepID=A0A2I2KL62_9ACTN|nr:hypothetical protein FRACA_1380019 [Frankia canadensis]SOU53674.1 hypothetical protein FRACA_1380019 [Frankia canadensis]
MADDLTPDDLTPDDPAADDPAAGGRMPDSPASVGRVTAGGTEEGRAMAGSAGAGEVGEVAGGEAERLRPVGRAPFAAVPVREPEPRSVAVRDRRSSTVRPMVALCPKGAGVMPSVP